MGEGVWVREFCGHVHGRDYWGQYTNCITVIFCGGSTLTAYSVRSKVIRWVEDGVQCSLRLGEVCASL